MQRVDIASCDKLVRTVETLSSYYRDASDLVFAVCHELGGMYDAAFDVHTAFRVMKDGMCSSVNPAYRGLPDSSGLLPARVEESLKGDTPGWAYASALRYYLLREKMPHETFSEVKIDDNDGTVMLIAPGRFHVLVHPMVDASTTTTRSDDGRAKRCMFFWRVLSFEFHVGNRKRGLHISATQKEQLRAIIEFRAAAAEDRLLELARVMNLAYATVALPYVRKLVRELEWPSMVVRDGVHGEGEHEMRLYYWGDASASATPPCLLIGSRNGTLVCEHHPLLSLHGETLPLQLPTLNSSDSVRALLMRTASLYALSILEKLTKPDSHCVASPLFETSLHVGCMDVDALRGVDASSVVVDGVPRVDVRRASASASSSSTANTLATVSIDFLRGRLIYETVNAKSMPDESVSIAWSSDAALVSRLLYSMAIRAIKLEVGERIMHAGRVYAIEGFSLLNHFKDDASAHDGLQRTASGRDGSEDLLHRQCMDVSVRIRLPSYCCDPYDTGFAIFATLSVDERTGACHAQNACVEVQESSARNLRSLPLDATEAFGTSARAPVKEEVVVDAKATKKRRKADTTAEATGGSRKGRHMNGTDALDMETVLAKGVWIARTESLRLYAEMYGLSLSETTQASIDVAPGGGATIIRFTLDGLSKSVHDVSSDVFVMSIRIRDSSQDEWDAVVTRKDVASWEKLSMETFVASEKFEMTQDEYSDCAIHVSDAGQTYYRLWGFHARTVTRLLSRAAARI